MTKYIYYACLTIFVLFVILQYPIGKSVAFFLEKKDKSVYGAILPHKFGTMYRCCFLMPLLGMVVGLTIHGDSAMWFAVIISLIMFAVLMFLKNTTVLTIDNGYIIIKELKHIQKIPLHDIDSVGFGISRIPYNRSLVITLRNGVRLTYEQENYYGLSWFYQRFNEVRPAQGDGLCEP